MRNVLRLSSRLSIGVLIVLVACGDRKDPIEADRPEPGELVVSLAGLPASASGIVLALSGPVLPTEVTTIRATDILHLRNSAAEARVAVFGTSMSGNLLRFKVPDVRKMASYQTRILEAAGEDNQLIEIAGATAAITR
jgi:hypothetical protein